MNSGDSVGSYRILGKLGEGGMGEVYRARHLRLQRDVALKVLPAALVADPERRARFEREARVLAALSHPNIAAIHGIEEAAGPDGSPTTLLVLELVDGRTLADRISAQPVPIEESAAIALQIAEGLEAAHERGIIHRDLKPANVQVTPEGKVKILDFGLAKALDADGSPGSSDAAYSPTITSASTQLGVILGTAAYMAPEQARGKAVDRRADVWAFGAVLFEMLAGTRAFPGETISDTIAAVLTATPDWSRLPPDTPAQVRTLLARCLDRDPRQRLQSIGEARILLSGPMASRAEVVTREPARSGIRPAVVAALMVGAAGLAGATAWWLLGAANSESPSVARRFDLALEALQVSHDRSPIISPDGARIAYSADSRLWIRSLLDFDPKEVQGSREAIYPAWSQDGRQLAFVQGTRLFRAPADGGAPQLVGSVPGDMTGSGAVVWRTDGSFVVVGSDTAGITEISGGDGSSREILPLDRKIESDFHELSLLPDGQSLLFTAHRNEGADTIGVLANGTRKDVLRIPGDNLRAPVYHPDGYLLFARETLQRGVWGVRFSLRSLQTEGDPFLVDAAAKYPSVARDGTLAMARGSGLPSELVWIDRAGSVTVAGALPGRVVESPYWPTMRLSPDGGKVAVALSDELWVFDLNRGVASPLVRGIPTPVWPTWLPDGSRVLFAGFAGSPRWSVQMVSANETSPARRVLPASGEFQWPTAISPDGRSLLYGQSFSRAADLWLAPLDKPGEAKPLMVTPSNEREGHFSPDGRWLAYTSDESGRTELYVRRFPIGEDREMLSNGGVSAVNWSREGGEIFYRSGTAVMSVRVTEENGRLTPSPPQRLFATTDSTLSQTFVVSRDGQRFLFARAPGGDRVGLVLNWAPPSEK